MKTGTDARGIARHADDARWSACPCCGSATPLHCMREPLKNPLERTAVWCLGVIALGMTGLMLAEIVYGPAVFSLPFIRTLLLGH
ncbi:MAG: hypothetical protein ACYC7E_21500 [Armatimonadota bacterium]